MTERTSEAGTENGRAEGAAKPGTPPAPGWEGRILPANTGRTRTGSTRGEDEPSTNGTPPREREEDRAAPDDAELPERSPSGGSLWLWWTIATVLGWALAGACVGAFFDPTDATPWQYVFVPLIALFQWLLLRRHFARASLWLAATIAGTIVAALAYAALLALPEAIFGAPTSGLRSGISDLTDGIAIGVAQWFVLRQTVHGASRWLPAFISPLALFGWLDFQRGREAAEVIDTVTRSDQIALAAANTAILGLMIGVLTGFVLMKLVEEPR